MVTILHSLYVYTEIAGTLEGEYSSEGGRLMVKVTFPPANCRSPQYELFYTRLDHGEDRRYVSDRIKLNASVSVNISSQWSGSSYFFRGTVICQHLRKVLHWGFHTERSGMQLVGLDSQFSYESKSTYVLCVLYGEIIRLRHILPDDNILKITFSTNNNVFS